MHTKNLALHGAVDDKTSDIYGYGNSICSSYKEPKDTIHIVLELLGCSLNDATSA